MADDADRAQELELAERQSALQRHRLRLVDVPRPDAQGRRLCVDCGNPIPKARLDAMPAATRCIECQVRHDHWSRPRG